MTAKVGLVGELQKMVNIVIDNNYTMNLRKIVMETKPWIISRMNSICINYIY